MAAPRALPAMQEAAVVRHVHCCVQAEPHIFHASTVSAQYIPYATACSSARQASPAPASTHACTWAQRQHATDAVRLHSTRSALIPSSHRHSLSKIVRTQRPHPRHGKAAPSASKRHRQWHFSAKRSALFPARLMLQLVDATLSSGSTDMAFS